MKPIIFDLFEESEIALNLQRTFDFEMGRFTLRSFPDNETYIQINSELKYRHVIFVASLNQPNLKALPLLFAAETARDLGANKITLLAPYLSYMRQDKKFKAGEGITSKFFAAFISQHFDELITIDPHLHRYHSLNDIYLTKNFVLQASDAIITWIKSHVTSPLIIGPDSESHSMIQQIAEKLSAPYFVAKKIRTGDHDVSVSLNISGKFNDHTPLLVDDIISTGSTMVKTIEQLKKSKTAPPICIGVHAIFSGSAYENLLKAGANKIVTCNTIKHMSNEIDVTPIIATLFSK